MYVCKRKEANFLTNSLNLQIDLTIEMLRLTAFKNCVHGKSNGRISREEVAASVQNNYVAMTLQ